VSEELFELISRHFPVAEADAVKCSCGAKFLTVDWWSKHLADEIEVKKEKAREASSSAD
jgi:hypothetical protein